MKRNFALLGLATWMMLAANAQDKPGKTLEMYFIDTEGGLSALYVSPSGESLLIDTGSPGARDADRIMEAVETRSHENAGRHVKVFVSRMRQKLRERGLVGDLLVSVRSLGYMLDLAVVAENGERK